MGALFSNCAVVLARRKARSRGARCIAILKETETHLNAMQQKYQAQLSDVNEAIAVGQALPSKSAHEKQVRKDRLIELLRKNPAPLLGRVPQAQQSDAGQNDGHRAARDQRHAAASHQKHGGGV